MLNLHPGVHLNKVKRVVFEQELKRARAAIPHVEAGTHTGISNLVAQGIIDTRGWRLLDDFLVAALQRAVAITEMNRIALPVRQYLDFDVARPLQEFLHVHDRRAKGRLGLGLCHLYRGEQHLFVVHHPHAATTAAGSRLHNHRETDFSRDPNHLVRIVGERTFRARYRRHTGTLHLLLG